MNRINIFTEGKIKLPYKKTKKTDFKNISSKILEMLDIKNVEVNLILTDDNIIKEINRSYRNKDYPTDVISFAYREYGETSGKATRTKELLGDIYLSLEKAESQHKEFNTTFIEEIKRLIVHSILHLLGYDHEKSRSEKIKMEKKEDELLSALETI